MRVEYIWPDGGSKKDPTPNLRSKTRVLAPEDLVEPVDFPIWNFDGSSTNQAETRRSDCILRPAYALPDPLRKPVIDGNPKHVRPASCNTLLLCEVLNSDGTPHQSNTRHLLEKAVAAFSQEFEPWCSVEQEYTLFEKTGREPLAFTELGKKFLAKDQGPFYCSVGSEWNVGRILAEKHLEACLSVGLHISGINAEVMPGQYEFQLGPLDPLLCADQLLLARWLLKRIGEDYGIAVSFAPKPAAGLNGAGAHVNFSTKRMRDTGALEEIDIACRKLERLHAEHIAVYGFGNERRLTGHFETSAMDEFRYGISDRGASVRISENMTGRYEYLEDRRPAANMDPYIVLTALLETICGKGFQPPVS